MMLGSREERRAARRWTPQELPWPVACRITPGHDVLIVNLSAVGVLVEVPATLPPGLELALHFIRPSRRVTLSGRVVRSFVAAVGGSEGPSFRAGIAFNRWFEALWELDSQAWEAEAPECDRLMSGS
jgi:PilZ domain